MKRINFIILLFLACFLSIQAKPKKSKVQKPAYLFGVAISMTDSTAFVTDIQTVDSLITDKDGFIPYEEEYSLQLKLYLENNMKLRDRVCAVFYDTDTKDLEKEYKKVLTKLKTKNKYQVSELKSSDFKFQLYKEEEE